MTTFAHDNPAFELPERGTIAERRRAHAAEVMADLASNDGADLGILVPAATMDLVAAIASGGERMPPKSTYFYPKIGSGLAFHALR